MKTCRVFRSDQKTPDDAFRSARKVIFPAELTEIGLLPVTDYKRKKSAALPPDCYAPRYLIVRSFGLKSNCRSFRAFLAFFILKLQQEIFHNLQLATNTTSSYATDNKSRKQADSKHDQVAARQTKPGQASVSRCEFLRNFRDDFEHLQTAFSVYSHTSWSHPLINTTYTSAKHAGPAINCFWFTLASHKELAQVNT